MGDSKLVTGSRGFDSRKNFHRVFIIIYFIFSQLERTEMTASRLILGPQGLKMRLYWKRQTKIVLKCSTIKLFGLTNQRM